MTVVTFRDTSKFSGVNTAIMSMFVLFSQRFGLIWKWKLGDKSFTQTVKQDVLVTFSKVQ